MSKLVGPQLAHLSCAYAAAAEGEAFPDYETVAQAVVSEPKFHFAANLEDAPAGLAVLLYECVQYVQLDTVKRWIINASRDMTASISLHELATRLLEKLPTNGKTEGYPTTLKDAREAILRYMPQG